MNLRQELEANFDTLKGMAMKLTRDLDLAEDVVQESVLRALKFENSYIPGETFFSWMYSIMRNSFYNQMRDATKHSELNYIHIENEEFFADCKELDRTQLEMQNSIFQSLEILSDAKRETLELFILGFSYAEIGRVLKIPTGTVRSRTYYALKELRKHLGVN